MSRALLAVALAFGCEQPSRAPSPAPSARTATSIAARRATPPPAPLASPGELASPGAPCRALRVTGSARLSSGGTLARAGRLDGASWVELETGAELALRHGISARELILSGPLRALPCRDGLEELIVSEGRVRSVAGTGVRPGGEVFIATPFAAIRYGDAAIELRVERERVVIDVQRGDVWVEAARGAHGFPADGRLRAKQRATSRGKTDSAQLLRDCELAAKQAADGALRVLSAGASSLGERASAQLVQRRHARAACGIAAAAAERIEPPAAKARLRDQITAAERLWRVIPTAAPNAPK